MDKMSVLDSEQFSTASIESDLERLTQMANEPRQYLDEYFNYVVRQIEAECLRYVQLQTEAYTRCLGADEVRAKMTRKFCIFSKKFSGLFNLQLL